jgi:hypothetical protein
MRVYAAAAPRVRFALDRVGRVGAVIVAGLVGRSGIDVLDRESLSLIS